MGERSCAEKVLCGCIAMPLEEFDSQVKVNWVFVGVVALFCWSSKLALLRPLGGEETAAAFAMAAEMIPWLEFLAGSPADGRNM